MIKDAEDMGGLDFVFESKLTPTDQDDVEVLGLFAMHKTVVLEALV